MSDADFFSAWARIQADELAQQREDVPWQEWRDRIAWTRAEDLELPPGRQVFRASTTLAAGQLLPPAGFHLADAWSTPPYRLVWINTHERVILTYVEGDLSYDVADTTQAAVQARRETAAFYHDLDL